MSFVGLSITCAVAFILLTGALRGLGFFFRRRMKNGYQLELPTFLFGTAGIFGIVCFLTFGVVLFPFNTAVSLEIMTVTGLALGTLFLTDGIIKNPRYRLGLLFALCLSGTFLIPQTAALWTAPFGWLLCVPLAVLWFLFMLMMVTLDRVMLLGFLMLSSLIIGVSLASFSAFQLFPSVFNVLFLTLLFLLLGQVYYLKNNGCYILGRPAVLFVSYLLGYMGVVLATTGNALYVPVFVSYELFEIGVAMGTNFWLYKKLTPIQVPFMIERALMKNIGVSQLFRAVFWWCLTFTLLGVVSSKVLLGYLFTPYVFVALLLSLVYTRLNDWGKPRVKYKDLFTDLKKGFVALKQEMMNPPLKTKSKTLNKKKKK